MLNYCVLSGIVCDRVAQATERDGHTRIWFLLAIQFLGKPVGRIDVLSSSHLTFLAAKNLRQGDRVAVMGFLSMREWQSRDGEWNNDATLNAMDLELLNRGVHTLG
jgi:primosomal replication protein N